MITLSLVVVLCSPMPIDHTSQCDISVPETWAYESHQQDQKTQDAIQCERKADEYRETLARVGIEPMVIGCTEQPINDYL